MCETTTVFDIPPEDADHPDIPCPAILDKGEVCGEILRWCPECEGYHHLNEMFWIMQHYTREVISPKDGSGHFRFGREKPCSLNEFTEALSRLENR